MTRLLTLVVLVLSLPACDVLGAIVYEPVQYQFGQQGRYYYGGSDASVHYDAHRFVDRRIYRDAEGMISDVPARVYSDSMPRLNGALYGLTSNDAKNDAYAAVPRYFRKVDLPNGSHVDCAGNLIVPATAPTSAACGSIVIKPWKGYEAVRTAKPVLIYPKSDLNLDAPLTLPQGSPSKA